MVTLGLSLAHTQQYSSRRNNVHVSTLCNLPSRSFNFWKNSLGICPETPFVPRLRPTTFFLSAVQVTPLHVQSNIGEKEGRMGQSKLSEAVKKKRLFTKSIISQIDTWLTMNIGKPTSLVEPLRSLEVCVKGCQGRALSGAVFVIGSQIELFQVTNRRKEKNVVGNGWELASVTKIGWIVMTSCDQDEPRSGDTLLHSYQRTKGAGSSRSGFPPRVTVLTFSLEPDRSGIGPDNLICDAVTRRRQIYKEISQFQLNSTQRRQIKKFQ